MKAVISICILLFTMAASANVTCPSGAELFQSAQVEENAGLITFREIQKNGDLEGLEYTRKGCYMSSVLIAKVEGVSLDQLVGKSFFFVNRNSILAACNASGEKKYMQIGKILKAYGMLSATEALTILRPYCF